MNRIELRAQILSCSNCGLSSRCNAPVPFSGPTPARLAVIGEAPGKQEDEKGEPFIGPAGQMMRALLTKAGFRTEEVFFANAASCFPVDFQGKGRAPNDSELEACSKNLHDQIALSQAGYLLLAGSVPLKALKPRLKIGQVRGVPFFYGATRTQIGERLALPTYHPSYVLRRGGEGSDAYHAVMEDLAFLKRLIEAGPEGWLKLFPETCLHCDEWVSRFDDDGMGFCDDHWKK